MEVKMLSFRNFALVVLTLLIGIFSCAVASAADMSTVLQTGTDAVQGFTDLKHADGVLTGTYHSDGDTVTIEVRRGKRTPVTIRKLNPDWPLYEMDARILDSEGDPIYVQVGGHDPIDPTWGPDFDASLSAREAMEPAARDAKAAKSYETAYEMLHTLKSAKLKNSLAPEKAALYGVMNILQSAMAVETLSDEQNQAQLLGCGDTQIIEVWKIGAFFPGNIFGDHSGTLMKTTSSGRTYTIWVAGNHGKAPGQSGMTKSCSASYGGRCGQSFAPPMCSTPLQWETSNPIQDDYKHVCNDDSYIQVQRIKTNSSVSTSGGTCKDTSLRNRAPSCN